MGNAHAPIPERVEIPRFDPAIVTSAQAALTLAREFKIDSVEMYELAGGELREIVTKKKLLDEKRLAITRPIDVAKKAVMDLFRGPTEALELAEQTIKRSMVTFDNAERQRRAEEERKARAAAEAERRRIEEEALARAAEVERQEREHAEAVAAELEQMGDAQQAKEVRETAQIEAAQKADEVMREAAADAQTLVSFAPTSAAPKAAGIATREVWYSEVTDLDALIKAAAAGNSSARECLMANDKVLGAKVRSLKGALSLPGVRVWSENAIAARRA
jgi:hypothetical protein